MPKALYSFREAAALIEPRVSALNLPMDHRLGGFAIDMELALLTQWRIYLHAEHDNAHSQTPGNFGNRLFVNGNQRTVDVFTGSPDYTLNTPALFCLAYGVRGARYLPYLMRTIPDAQSAYHPLLEADATSHAAITASTRHDYKVAAEALPPFLAAARRLFDNDGHPASDPFGTSLPGFHPAIYKDAKVQEILQAAQLRDRDLGFAALTSFLYDSDVSPMTSASLFLRAIDPTEKQAETDPFRAYLFRLKRMWPGFTGANAVMAELSLFRKIKLLAADYLLEEQAHPTGASVIAAPATNVVTFDLDFRDKLKKRRRSGPSSSPSPETGP
jgi:hypothetical protein